MRYSLASRFRGTLLGAALGELSNRNQPSGWGRMAVLAAESLTRCGRFDLEDWKIHSKSEFPTSDAMVEHTVEGIALDTTLQIRFEKPDTIAPIVATLPVALFFHENEIKLRQNLLSALQIRFEKPEPILRDGALAVGYAIAQSLQEQLNPATLIPQTIAFIGETETNIPQQLTLVNSLLEQNAGLSQAVAQLRGEELSSALAKRCAEGIALGFYCFLSTPEDFRLSVKRAEHTGYPQIATVIAAMSGAYNSTAGIPPSWKVALSQPNSSNQLPLAAWGMKTPAEILKLADSLLAVWSGVYDQGISDVAPLPDVAIASPRVMRLR